MRSKRAEFSPETKIACFKRDKGKCRVCTQTIVTVAHYDHFPVPAAIGGSADLYNCRLLCRECHEKRTRTVDIPAIAKTKRIVETRMGLRAPKRPMPGSRASPWRKKMDGTVERR